jgi:arylsulfatase A
MSAVNRRRFCASLGALSAAVCVPGLAAQATGGERPNLVYILCDDLGFGDVNALNPLRGKIATPNMDELRAEGMAFTDCHSSCAVCTPSRYSILTGRYCWRTRLQRGVLGGDSPPLISDNRMTVGQLFQQHGYTTAAMGKWHLGLDFDKQDFTKPITDGPLQHGFNYFFGISASLDMPPYDFIENNHWTEVPSVEKRFGSDSYGPVFVKGPARLGPAAPDFDPTNVLPKLTEKATGYIDRRGKDHKPFFLYLALPSPHTPLVPEKRWQGKSGMGPYGDYVMETDWSVGQVMRAIQQADLQESTIVMLASDNGCAPYINAAGMEKYGHYASAWFRGYKSDIWDGGHRIPYIVRWPGIVRPGSTCMQTVELTDLTATVADILGVHLPPNAGVDSVSLLPLFKGAHRSVHPYNVYQSINGDFAIQEGKWKLELCAGSGGWEVPKNKEAVAEGLPPVQLYNMESDISETTNVEAAHPDIVARLIEELKTCIANGRSTPGPKQTNDVPINMWKLPATPAVIQKLLEVGD